mmetsp:Transcript_2016/g.4395  ORF Transcript_2016/g.4395 Transcript_2016/m.4395 type:complete len:375 (+) Transcript_2016:170-1294(+)
MTLQEHTSKKDGQNSVQLTGTVKRSVEPLPVAVQFSFSAASSTLRDVATDSPGVPKLAPPKESGGERDPEGRFLGKKRSTVVPIPSEERRIRKNLLGRARALRMRNNLEKIQQKPVVCTEEKERLGKLEEQRQKNNSRSTQRLIERKKEIERILATPKAMRSECQRKTLVIELRAEEKKNGGDRLRRERRREEKGKVPPTGRLPTHRPKRGPVAPETRQPASPIDVGGSGLPVRAAPSSTLRIHQSGAPSAAPVGQTQMPFPRIPPVGPTMPSAKRPESPMDVGGAGLPVGAAPSSTLPTHQSVAQSAAPVIQAQMPLSTIPPFVPSQSASLGETNLGNILGPWLLQKLRTLEGRSAHCRHYHFTVNGRKIIRD